MSGIKHASVGQVITEAEWEADNIHIIESGTSFPGSPVEKDLYYRTDEHKWYIYNGTTWKELTAAGIDISDADAAVGDVKSPRTFYSVEEPKKTGTLPTVALAPGSSAYPEGYHAGDGGGLPAIDADLVTGSIKSGVTIFNVAGHTDVRNVSDADALVAEVKSPKTFYAVGGAKKTGTMPTRAIVASSDTYQAGYHAGNAGGLDAIDTHLAPANIKTGVNIFGKVGTFAGGPPVQDLVTAVPCTIQTNTTNLYSQHESWSNSTIIATTTPNFAANSLAIGVATAYVCRSSGTWRLRLEMDGVVVAESSNVTDCGGNDYDCVNYVLIGSKALVGAKVCLARMYEVSSGSFATLANRYGDERLVGCIAVGSVKL